MQSVLPLGGPALAAPALLVEADVTVAIHWTMTEFDQAIDQVLRIRDRAEGPEILNPDISIEFTAWKTDLDDSALPLTLTLRRESGGRVLRFQLDFCRFHNDLLQSHGRYFADYEARIVEVAPC